MAIIKREKVAMDIENDIITGIIVSNSFSRQIVPKIKSEYLESEYAKIVFEWCKEFFLKYNEAPGKHIKEIYKSKREQIEDDKSELIANFLSTLSQKYAEKSQFNEQYRIDQTLKHIEERALKVKSENVQRYIEMGRMDKAQQEMHSYREVAKSTSKWANPMDKKFVREVMFGEDDEEEIFTFPGALGALSGPECRGYLIAILGPMKRGKSFWLQEMMLHAAMNRKKCVYFSLEMSEKRIEKRIMRRLLAFGKMDGLYLYPVFDCEKNQDGTCEKRERLNRIRLLDAEGNKPKFSTDMRYRPCVACRGKKDYAVANWFTTMKRSIPTVARMVRKTESFMKMYGDNIRIKSFPAGSLTSSMVKAELDHLKYIESFEADLIGIDYPKLMRAETPGLMGIEKVDASWIALKGLADERHACVAAPTQGTRISLDVKNVMSKHIAGYIDILAHIDKMYAISQTPVEKREGILRIGVIGSRDEDFDEEKHVVILQQRGVGQTLLDSELAEGKFGIEEEDKLLNTI